MVEVKTVKMLDLTGKIVFVKEEKERRESEHKHTGPWNGICCEACWFAKEERCVCKCGGRNHGRGLAKTYTKLDDFPTWQDECEENEPFFDSLEDFLRAYSHVLEKATVPNLYEANQALEAMVDE